MEQRQRRRYGCQPLRCHPVLGRLCAEPPRCTRRGQRSGTGRSTRQRDERADSLRIQGQSIYGPRNRLFPGQGNRKNKLLKPEVPFTAVYRIVRMTVGNPAPLPTVGETGCANIVSSRLFPIPCFSLRYALPNGRPPSHRAESASPYGTCRCTLQLSERSSCAPSGRTDTDCLRTNRIPEIVPMHEKIRKTVPPKVSFRRHCSDSDAAAVPHTAPLRMVSEAPDVQK